MKELLYIILIGIVVIGWSPWFKETEARELIVAKVRESQSTLQNGCLLTINVDTLEKIPFGYKQTVAYDCTINTDFISEGTNVVFVPFFKEVINVPHPLIK